MPVAVKPRVLIADDQPDVLEALRLLLKGEQYEIEFRLRRSDGEYRWHLGRAEPVRDGSGRVVKWFGTNTDITDAKEAQAQLRDESRRVPLLLRAASDRQTPCCSCCRAARPLRASRRQSARHRRAE